MSGNRIQNTSYFLQYERILLSYYRIFCHNVGIVDVNVNDGVTVYNLQLHVTLPNGCSTSRVQLKDLSSSRDGWDICTCIL